MRNVKDSFLHHLADNLSIEVNSIRTDQSDPSHNTLKLNALNVEILDVTPSFGRATMRVALDVVFDDENTALDAITSIWNLFKLSFFTPVLDYSQNTPTDTGVRVFWEPESSRFTRVSANRYCHYTCTLTLRFSQV
jgi:hypothetical protein